MKAKLLNMIDSPRFWFMLIAIIAVATGTTDTLKEWLVRFSEMTGTIGLIVQTYDRTIDSLK